MLNVESSILPGVLEKQIEHLEAAYHNLVWLHYTAVLQLCFSYTPLPKSENLILSARRTMADYFFQCDIKHYSLYPQIKSQTFSISPQIKRPWDV